MIELVAMPVLAAVLSQPACPRESWPLFESYMQAFLSKDGRIIDHTDGGHSTSEGQAYGLFFSLVANDRERFERILRWTKNNLSRGDLSKNLPSWKWGKEKGRYKVLDRNSASDADLWIAWTLLEAGRLWKSEAYARQGRQLLALITKKEVVSIPGLGPMLLPGPKGFEVEKGEAWRLNPSYLPLPLLRRFQALRLPGPWDDLIVATGRMLEESAPMGLFPDWTLFRKGKGFQIDPVTRGIGGYDAIRVYLWAALTSREDSLAPLLQRIALKPVIYFQEHGQVFERIDAATGNVLGTAAPPGFLATVRLLSKYRPGVDEALAEKLKEASHDGLFGDPPRYYDQNLALFSLGALENRFLFDVEGGLVPRWEAMCAP